MSRARPSRGKSRKIAYVDLRLVATCWWETSKESIQLLLDRGIEYDHSSQAHDCQPFYTRDEDTWTCIDYKEKADTWMAPLVRGQDTKLVTVPASWYLDDLPPHLFIKSAPNSHGFVDARVTLQLWKDHFTYFYREEDWFVFPLTIHPDTSGRPHLLLILEELIEWINGHGELFSCPRICPARWLTLSLHSEGVQWVTMEVSLPSFRLPSSEADQLTENALLAGDQRRVSRSQPFSVRGRKEVGEESCTYHARASRAA